MSTENTGLAPGPWRLTGAPSYRNVVDANGVVVCSVAARIGDEANARALAEVHRTNHAARDALRVLTAYFDGDGPDISDASQVIDELAALVAAVFGNANAPADDTTPPRAAKRVKAAKTTHASGDNLT